MEILSSTSLEYLRREIYIFWKIVRYFEVLVVHSLRKTQMYISFISSIPWLLLDHPRPLSET